MLTHTGYKLCTIKSVYLENTTDNHNKFYQLNIDKYNDGYAVEAFFGKMGYIPKSQIKALKLTLEKAYELIEIICQDKIKGGYVLIKTTNYSDDKFNVSSVSKNDTLNMKSQSLQDVMAISFAEDL